MNRETKETVVEVSWAPGDGPSRVELLGALEGSEPGETGIDGRVAYAKHMLETFAHWAGHELGLRAQSKDGLVHHLLEDASIVLGRAVRQATDTGTIQRVAHRVMPMDEALVLVALDLVERPYYEGPLPDPLMDHMMRSLAQEAGMTLHVQVLRGRDPHHIIEGAWKALGLCLHDATRPRAARLSTKGAQEVA